MPITHAEWRADMTDAAAICQAIAERLDTRIADLEARGAGPMHIALVRQRYAGMLDVAQTGRRIVAVTDDRYIPVGEAVTGGGGLDWLAGDKEFHSHD
jgi:hypothetical protein